MLKEIRKKIIEKAVEANNLPILPDIAFEIMSLSENDNRSMKQISDFISKDPSLTASILKVANSAFYGLKNNVGSLEIALIILGLREIKNIVFMMSLFKLFPSDGEFAFDKYDYLKHSILTANTAKKLAQILKLEFKSSPFICGLLHDIGKIFLDQNSHEEFIEVLKQVKKKNVYMYEAEKNFLGIDHAEVGSILSQAWNFPEEMTDAIKFHHNVKNSLKDKTLTSIIHLANLFTNARKIGLPESSRGVKIIDDIGWIFIGERNPFLKDLDLEKIIFEIDDDLYKVQEIIKFYASKFFNE